MTRDQFFDTYAEWAVLSQARSGVPASVTLAQGAIESDNGNSWLARNANNYFGIQCHGFGNCVQRTDKDAAGNPYPASFRKYNSVYDSFIDHADFLVGQNRYNDCFKNTNYRDWAYCLKSSGYAESTTYATDLINIIEQYGLDRYDVQGNEQMGEFTNTVIRNRKQIVIIGSVVLVLLIFLWIAFKKIIGNK